MAVSTEPIAGVNLAYTVNGTLVGAQEDATLSVPTEVKELVTKNNFGWVDNLSGMQEWSVEHSGYVVNSSGNEFISTNDATLEIKADFTSDSTDNPSWHTIQYLDSIDMTLEAGVAETGALDKQLWRYIKPAERSMTLDVEGSYLDPNATVGEEYEELFKRKDNGTRIPARFTIAGKEFESDVAVGDIEIEASGSAEDATISLTMESSGQVTTAGSSFETNVEPILDAFFNENLATAVIEHRDGGSRVSGSTYFEGDGYFTSINVTAEHGEPATLDATIEGDGPLARKDAA